MPSTLRSGKSTPTLTDRTLSPTPDQFPLLAGQSLFVSKRDNGIISPTKSTFSFADEDPALPNVSPQSDLIDEKRIVRHMRRDPPGDSTVMSMDNRNREDIEHSQRKSKFYGEVFAYREPNLSARDRISRDSIVTAEVKTNVIVKDEYTFLTTLSNHLSTRYQRPPTSILIHLTHSACLLLASSFDPAYHLTITALNSLVQPTTNKRNAALVQAFMADVLGVESSRGVVRFIGVKEEDLATRGVTVAGEIETLANGGKDEGVGEQSDNDRGGVIGTIKRNATRSRSRRRQTVEIRKDLPLREERNRPPTRDKSKVSSPLQSPPLPPLPTGKSALDKRAEKAQKVGRRKSFMAMFGR